MYYSIFEGVPYGDKIDTAVRYYQFLLPKVQKNEEFRGDNMYASPHIANKSVNVAEWDHMDAVNRWRNETSHLNAQEKASDGVYESYRLRLGPGVMQDSSSDSSKVRHHMTLYYPKIVEGTPTDDVTTLLDASNASELKEVLIDSSVYQGQSTLWISAWRSKEAAVRFEKAVQQRISGKVVHVQIHRDYAKTERKDAPHEKAGMKL